MLNQIDIWTWIILFCVYLVFDSLYALYIKAISELRPLRASFLSAGMYILTAYGTIEYVNNPINLIPLLAGGFIGTFVTLRWNKKHNGKTDN